MRCLLLGRQQRHPDVVEALPSCAELLGDCRVRAILELTSEHVHACASCREGFIRFVVHCGQELVVFARLRCRQAFSDVASHLEKVSTEIRHLADQLQAAVDMPTGKLVALTSAQQVGEAGVGIGEDLSHLWQVQTSRGQWSVDDLFQRGHRAVWVLRFLQIGPMVSGARPTEKCKQSGIDGPGACLRGRWLDVFPASRMDHDAAKSQED